MGKRSLLALGMMILVISLAACSAAAAPTMAPASMDKSAGAPAPAQPEAQRSSLGYTSGQTNATGYTTSSASSTVDRLVIKNANLGIIVADPGATMNVISSMATSMNGFVVSSNLYKTSTSSGQQVPEASITIRVPSESMDEALQKIRAQVKDPANDITLDNVTGQDVTKDYTDLQSQLTNLQNAESQLREIMASATKPEDVLNVFNQLTQVRGQIETIQGQIKYYEEAAAMSAISVAIQAEAAVQPLSIGGWQPVGVARDAVQAMVNTMKVLANAAIWLILFALPVGLVIFIPLRLLWALFKRWRGRHKLPKTPPAPQVAPPPAG